jgi:Xaa-Pro aminopeptidase
MFRQREQRPLEPGMVMSLEAQFEHPEAGDIRIEDMVAVTAIGCEPLGHTGRDWCIV